MPAVMSNSSGIIFAVLAALCWGAAIVMSKGALDGFSPILLLVVQLSASVVLLWLIVWNKCPERSPPNVVLKFAWLGLLEPGLAYLLSLIGLANTEASNAALIYSTEPIVIVMLSAFFFKEFPTGKFIFLSILAVGGIIFTIGMSATAVKEINVTANLLIVAGTVVAAMYVVLTSKLATSASPLYIVAWQQTVALVFALLLLPVETIAFPDIVLHRSSINLWLLAASSGIVQYALAFSLYVAALRTISANTAGVFLNLVPIFGITGAFLFLEEYILPIQCLGMLVTIVAVTIISLESRSPASSH